MKIRDYGQKIVDGILATNLLDNRKLGYKFMAIQSGSNLGYSDHKNRVVAVNSEIIDDDDWLDTLLHEIAHIIAVHVYGNRTHDKQFKMICEIMKCDGNSSAAVKVEHNYKYDKYCGCGKRGGQSRISARKKRQYDTGLWRCSVCHKDIRIVQNW